MAGSFRRRCIFGILTLTMTGFLVARFDGSAASNVTQEGNEKVLKKLEYRNPVTDLVNLRVENVSTAFGRKISGGDDWLKGLTVSVKNTSTQPIVYVQMDIELFGEKDDEEAGRLPYMYSLSYGDYHHYDPSYPPLFHQYQAIAPGDSVDITLTDEDYASLIGRLSANAYPLPLKHAELSVTDVIFADGTRWYKSMFLQRDPNNPKEWLRIRKTGARREGKYPRPPGTINPPGGANAAFFLARYSPGRAFTLAPTSFPSTKIVKPALQTETCKEARPSEAFPCGHEAPLCTAQNDRLHDYEGIEAPAKLIRRVRVCKRGGQSCNFEVTLSELEFCPPPTPPPGGCDGPAGSQTGDDGGSGGVGCNSPVVVDVLGDGFDLTDAAGGVWFDLNSDGATQRLAWTAASSDDAWLALDRDGNGTIDSGQELFGNFTPQPEPPADEERQGFLALAVFDKPQHGGNSDGVINRQDAVFDALRLWQDMNHNGFSEPNELHRLRALGLRTLELDYRQSKRTDEHGNRFRYRAKVKDTRGAQLGRWAWDVFLVTGP